MNWKDLQNKHLGETCLIIGNGPSLKDMPISFLKSYPSFGSNRIYLLDGFTPDYYACVNPLVIEQFCSEINDMPARAKFIAMTNGLHFTIENSFGVKSSGMPIFSFWPDKWIYEGHTVTYVLMQLAYYMGFKRALLVGVDHRFTYEGAPNELKKAKWEIDPNHFCGQYFSSGTKWNNPDLEASEHAYRMAKISFENNNREIINLTPNSALDIFKKEDWQTWELQ